MAKRYTGKKLSRMGVKGLRAGVNEAKRVIANRGCSIAHKKVRDLVTYYGDSFEKQYAHGFTKLVAKRCGGR